MWLIVIALGFGLSFAFLGQFLEALLYATIAGVLVVHEIYMRRNND